MKIKIPPFLSLATGLTLVAASGGSAASDLSLKDAFKDYFTIGAALNPSHHRENNPAYYDIVSANFNTITAENVMKWQPIHPRPEEYDFAAADSFVEFGERHDMFIVGHTLVWHSQTPSWVFEDEEGNPLDRDALLERMRDHIHTVVGRYKGRVQGWDVVNEALNEDGSLRNSPWRRIIGDDYLVKAFEYAHEADPDAELYYNDYSIENPAKRNGVVRIVRMLQEAGAPITGVGIQGHGNLTWPPPQLVADTIEAFAELGMRVMITELDISVLPSRSEVVTADIGEREEGGDALNPYTDGLPEEKQQELADRYAELFEVYLQYSDVLDRVTFWGVTDGASWLNNFPIRGRTNYPLLFDREGKPKPAYHVVIETAQNFDRSREEARTFRNPVMSGFHADPSLIRVGDDYYTVHSTFEYFPGVFVMHSRDLVNWRQIGNAIHRTEQLDLGNVPSSGGIFAPTIRYHDGLFYMITTSVWGGGNFYVTAEDPAGPWSDPVWLDAAGIDPSLYFKDDGTVLYHRQVDGERGFTGQQVLNLETGELEGELVELWRGTGGIWPEGPHLYHVDDTWYLKISEGGTSYGHMVTVARSDSPWGPFEPNPDNPILTHRHLPDHPFQALGHSDMVETPDGWWMVFLGFRPQGGNYHHIGRETFLAPVTWEDGWPVVNNNEPIAEEMPAPRLPEHPWPEEPVRQEFDSAALPPWWQHIRNPNEDDYSFTDRPGWLRLNGSASTLKDRASPAFLGRRQTALNCSAATRLSFDPANANEEAGLALRGSESYHTKFGVRLVNGQRHVFLRKVQDGEETETLSSEPLPDGDVILTVAAEPLNYTFFYEPANGGSRSEIGSQPTRELSSEQMSVDGGMSFTGVYFGMYATGNGADSEAPADFAWFDYETGEP